MVMNLTRLGFILAGSAVSSNTHRLSFALVVYLRYSGFGGSVQRIGKASTPKAFGLTSK